MKKTTDPKTNSGLGAEKEKLAADFKAIIADAEKIISSLHGEFDHKAEETKERLEQGLAEAKEKYQELDQRLAVAAENAGELAREHPFAAMGLSFGAGMLFTMLFLGRRS